MVVRVAQWTIDVEDLDLMARFWSQALDYTIEKGDDGSAKLGPRPDAPADRPSGCRARVLPSLSRTACTLTSCPTATRRGRWNG
jgi:hypothetical protein